MDASGRDELLRYLGGSVGLRAETEKNSGSDVIREEEPGQVYQFVATDWLLDLRKQSRQ